MNFQELFKSIEKQLKADLDKVRASISHASSKGIANEQTVKKFFKDKLPQNLDISSGFLIDCDKNVSKQLDIVIHDAAKTPILYQSEDIRVVPIECAYAVIEVKTNLTLSELDLCAENMRSVKTMIKKAFYSEGAVVTPTLAYGKEYRDWPLMYFIFAFDAAPLTSIAHKLTTMHMNSDIDKRIDCIYTLQHGVLANMGTGGMSALPYPESKLISVQNDALLLFYTLISHYFNQTYMRKFRFIDYVNSMKWDIRYLS
jgi:hypothetical protein